MLLGCGFCQRQSIAQTNPRDVKRTKLESSCCVATSPSVFVINHIIFEACFRICIIVIRTMQPFNKTNSRFVFLRTRPKIVRTNIQGIMSCARRLQRPWLQCMHNTLICVNLGFNLHDYVSCSIQNVIGQWIRQSRQHICNTQIKDVIKKNAKNELRVGISKNTETVSKKLRCILTNISWKYFDTVGL